jgi:hypothetical protein
LFLHQGPDIFVEDSEAEGDVIIINDKEDDEPNQGAKLWSLKRSARLANKARTAPVSSIEEVDGEGTYGDRVAHLNNVNSMGIDSPSNYFINPLYNPNRTIREDEADDNMLNNRTAVMDFPPWNLKKKEKK